VGLKAGQDRCGKSRPPPGIDPRTVQPVASRYTVYATRPMQYLVDTLKVFAFDKIIKTYRPPIFWRRLCEFESDADEF
jgi:hypothetical protein